MRKAKLAFPYIGNTYIDRFYVSANRPSSRYYNDARKCRDKIYERTCEFRKTKNLEEDKLIEQKKYDYAAKDYFLAGFDITRNAPLFSHQKHKGNCEEASRAVLAALYANRFYNSNLANLFYYAYAVNKKTGEIIEKQEKTIDHVFVLTDMGTGVKNIVIDPWLGFADSKSMAAGEYYNVFYDIELKYLKKRAKKECKRNLRARGIKYNKNDYYFKSGFAFRTKPTHKTDAIRNEAGYQFRTMYPELLLNKAK